MKRLLEALALTGVIAGLGCQGGVSGSARDAVPDATPDPASDPGTSDTPADGVVADDTTGTDDTTPDWAAGELSPEWQGRLDDRDLDYGAALRTASLRLRGDLPTLLEIRMLDEATDQASVYRSFLESFITDDRFIPQIRNYFRDTFKMGRGDLDTAPLFAAELAVEGRSMTELFTATNGTCPTMQDEAIVPADCDNGVPTHAGILTNPAVMRHFNSNLAFRRVRWVQETFACNAFPAELGDPIDIGGAAPYTAPWPFESIAGADTGGRIDFHDIESVTCANCHATMNHQAPLFGHFDADGRWSDSIAVTLPSDGSPLVAMSDWLPDGETTAWRFGVPAADLPAFGAAMAADRDVHRCTVSRAWNWAMGKGDIVLTRAAVPDEVIDTMVDDYIASGHRMDQLLLAIFTSDDFVNF